jgi:hypothetical protein
MFWTVFTPPLAGGSLAYLSFSFSRSISTLRPAGHWSIRSSLPSTVSREQVA